MVDLKTNTADQQQVTEGGGETENVPTRTILFQQLFIVIRASCGFSVTVNAPPTTCVCLLHFIPSCVHWRPNTRGYYAHLTSLTFSISVLSHQNTKYNPVRDLRS